MAAHSLETLVAQYRRQKAAPGHNHELELRLRGADYAVFRSVLDGLLKSKSDQQLQVDDGVITQVINVIREHGPKSSTTQQIRQLSFVDGLKATDKFVRKMRLAQPVIINIDGMAFTVALSDETEEGNNSFSADEGSLIRVKTRAGFTLRIPAEDKVLHAWRIDLTVVRQIHGPGGGSALPNIKAAMFPAGLTPANLAQRLKLDDPVAQGLYQFEVECEYLASVGGAGLRAQDVTRAAETVMQLVNPHHRKDSALQAEIHAIASLLDFAPALLRRFERDFGLKKLAPQVLSLTRAEYRAMFPPVGMFITAKVDGVRALVSVREGRANVAADKLYTFAKTADVNTDVQAKTAVTPSLVVDAEFVSPNTILIFDVIAQAGKNVSALPFEERIKLASAAATELKGYGLNASAKPYTPLTETNLEGAFRGVWGGGKMGAFEVDGIIIVRPGKGYLDTVSYKWKPLRQNTIDFLVRACPLKYQGVAPYDRRPGHDLYLLFCGIGPEMLRSLKMRPCPGYSEIFPDRRGAADRRDGAYMPIQFQPSDAPYAYLYWHPTPESKNADAKDAKNADAKDGKNADAKDAKNADAKDGKNADAKDAKNADAKDAKNADAKDVKNADTAPSTAHPSRRGVLELDGAVCEMRRVGDLSPQGLVNWELVRRREDREADLKSRAYFGNDFRIAELTWLNYIDPFPLEQLWQLGGGYFAEEKSGMFRAQTATTSFVKGTQIAGLSGSAVVVDLGVGRGADLGRYIEAGVQTLFGVDADRAALAELVKRKYSHLQKGREGSIDLRVVLADLTEPAADTTRKLERAGFTAGTADAVVMNLAVHYLMKSAESIRNFVNLCKALLKPGGKVVLTAMSGAEVYKLMKPLKVGESWDVREGGALKYSIRRDFTGAELASAGQQIGVLLPFSRGEYYKEYLVNIEFLSKAFYARGFYPTGSKSMGTFIPDFRVRNPVMAEQLTPDDVKYVSLYYVITYVNSKN